jgi:hypothetical protein
MVGDTGADFTVGMYDKDNSQTLLYRLDPAGGRISATDLKWSSHTYWRLKGGAANRAAIAQTWSQRTATVDGKQLTLSVEESNGAVKDVTVTRDDGQVLLKYRGYELSYVFDFMVWQGQLVFATGNGLYVSRPGSNQLRCILSEPDLLLLSSCIVGDQLVLGTSKGVYSLDAATFAKAATE